MPVVTGSIGQDSPSRLRFRPSPPQTFRLRLAASAYSSQKRSRPSHAPCSVRQQRYENAARRSRRVCEETFANSDAPSREEGGGSCASVRSSPPAPRRGWPTSPGGQSASVRRDPRTGSCEDRHHRHGTDRGGLARQLAGAGHELTLSFSRDPGKLDERARELGAGASAGTLAEAVDFGEVIVISVPWGVLPQALEQAGSLAGKIVIDTTNQFDAPLPAGETAARTSTPPVCGERATRSASTLLPLPSRPKRPGVTEKRVVQWLCGDDARREGGRRRIGRGRGLRSGRPWRHRRVLGDGGTEARGAVYGEEYRASDARAVVDAVSRRAAHDPANSSADRPADDAPGEGRHVIGAP